MSWSKVTDPGTVARKIADDNAVETMDDLLREVVPAVVIRDVVSVERCIFSLRFLYPCIFGESKLWNGGKESKTGLSPF